MEANNLCKKFVFINQSRKRENTIDCCIFDKMAWSSTQTTEKSVRHSRIVTTRHKEKNRYRNIDYSFRLAIAQKQQQNVMIIEL